MNYIQNRNFSSMLDGWQEPPDESSDPIDYWIEQCECELSERGYISDLEACDNKQAAIRYLRGQSRVEYWGSGRWEETVEEGKEQ